MCDEREKPTVRRTLPAAAVIVLSMVAGCGPTMDLPADFVRAHRLGVGGYRVRGVSADGVVAGVRDSYENPANGTLSFWSAAIRNELICSRGYVPVADEAVCSDAGRNGRLMTFQANRSGAEFTYLVAVYVTDRRVYVAEAGGRSETVKPRMANIRKALLSVR